MGRKTYEYVIPSCQEKGVLSWLCFAFLVRLPWAVNLLARSHTLVSSRDEVFPKHGREFKKSRVWREPSWPGPQRRRQLMRAVAP